MGAVNIIPFVGLLFLLCGLKCEFVEASCESSKDLKSISSNGFRDNDTLLLYYSIGQCEDGGSLSLTKYGCRFNQRRCMAEHNLPVVQNFVGTVQLIVALNPTPLHELVEPANTPSLRLNFWTEGTFLQILQTFGPDQMEGVYEDKYQATADVQKILDTFVNNDPDFQMTFENLINKDMSLDDFRASGGRNPSIMPRM